MLRARSTIVASARPVPWHEEPIGHCYPGSDDFQPTLPGQFMGFACLPPNAFRWGELALQFFLAHPKP